MLSVKFLLLTIFSIQVLAQEYNVKDFGAIGDGIADDTNAIRAALQAANNSNGGRVIFDAGSKFLTGCLQLSNNTILDVRGTILGSESSDHYDFPGINSTGYQSLIFTYNEKNISTNNVTITGGGLIDFQGPIWWACATKNNTSNPPCSGRGRPHGIYLHFASNVVVDNITIKDNASYQLGLAHLTNAYVNNVNIIAPDNNAAVNPSHNTDGVNMNAVANVLVQNSYISTGDDAIAIDSACGDVPSQNIIVRNMTIGHSHGLSVGVNTCGNILNVTFQDIVVNGTRDSRNYGIRVKGERGMGGLVQNITYSNIKIYNVFYCIRLNMNYSQHYTPPTYYNVTPHFQNISIHDIYCENATYAWAIEGLDDSEINANFWNINLTNTDHFSQFCSDIYGSCDNSTVFPKCPPCMSTTICEDTSTDCASYIGLCNNPTYHSMLCSKCRNTCKLCNSCN